MAILYVPLMVQKNVATSEAASNITFNKFVFDLANPFTTVNGVATTLIALAINDQLQIGTIPAGEILVPHLCEFDSAIIDTGITGNASIGITGTLAAIKAAASVQAAISAVGASFALATAEVGADNADTPVWLVFTAAVATLAATGKIVWRQVTRPWNSQTDGPSTT